MPPALPPGLTSINVRLGYLRRKNVQTFQKIAEEFKGIFPFVEDMRVSETSTFHNHHFNIPVPIVEIRERNSKAFIPITDISSGMQKVLLIITDIITAGSEKMYLIEEYENSLGINAIDFLPSFLLEHAGGRQTFVTSHHPTLINSAPISHWLVVSREGTKIRITPGTALEERYGTSKHSRFIQLLNDPIYREGVK